MIKDENADKALLAEIEGETEVLEVADESPNPGESLDHFAWYLAWAESGDTIGAWARGAEVASVDYVYQISSRWRWVARKAYRQIRRRERRIQRADEAAQEYLQGWIDMVEWGRSEIARMRAEGVRLTPREVVAMFKAATEAINAMKGSGPGLDPDLEDVPEEEIEAMLSFVNGLGAGSGAKNS